MHVYPPWYLCVDYTWLGRVSMCYLVAARTTSLHSSCHTRSLRWTCVHLTTRSFLIHVIMLVELVMSSTTSHLHQSLSLMSLYCLCTHLARTKCGSDYQQVSHSSYGNMISPIHHQWCKWMVPCVVIPQRRHPHPRMTTISYHCQCIECARAHKVCLCKACTFSGWLPPKGSTLSVGEEYIYKDVLWCTLSLTWIRDQKYLEIQDCCRNQSKEGLENQRQIPFYPSLPWPLLLSRPPSVQLCVSNLRLPRIPSCFQLLRLWSYLTAF